MLGTLEQRIATRLAKYYSQEAEENLETQLIRAVDYNWEDEENDDDRS
jgi:hypothetical protein